MTTQLRFPKIFFFCLAIIFTPWPGLSQLYGGGMGFDTIPGQINGKQTIYMFRLIKPGEGCVKGMACLTTNELKKTANLTPRNDGQGYYYIELPNNQVMAAKSLQQLRLQFSSSTDSIFVPPAYFPETKDEPIRVEKSELEMDEYLQLVSQWSANSLVNRDTAGCTLMADIAKYNQISCDENKCKYSYHQDDGVREKLLARYQKWASTTGGSPYCAGKSLDDTLETYKSYANTQLDIAIQYNPGKGTDFEKWREKINKRYDSQKLSYSQRELPTRAQASAARQAPPPQRPDYIESGCAKFAGSWMDISVTISGHCDPEKVLRLVRSEAAKIQPPFLNRKKWSTQIVGDPYICNMLIEFSSRKVSITKEDLEILMKELTPTKTSTPKEAEKDKPLDTTDFQSVKLKLERFNNTLFYRNPKCGTLYSPQANPDRKASPQPPATR